MIHETHELAAAWTVIGGMFFIVDMIFGAFPSCTFKNKGVPAIIGIVIVIIAGFSAI